MSDTCILRIHCAIRWRVVKQRVSENRPLMKNNFTGWKVSPFDADAMRLCMEGDCAEGSSAEDKVEDVIRKLTSTCRHTEEMGIHTSQSTGGVIE